MVACSQITGPAKLNGGKMYAPSSSHIEFGLDWYKSQGANQMEMDGKDSCVKTSCMLMNFDWPVKYYAMVVVASFTGELLVPSLKLSLVKSPKNLH